MAETAPAAAAPPAKAPKKKPAAKAKKAGPGAAELIVKAVSASKERSGVSLAALKKALAAGGYDVEKNNSRVKLAIKSLVTKGTLLQVKGTGASGSFKISKKQAETKKKAAPKAKKPAAAKKPKSAAAKKPAAKKSPKKTKKPAAAAKKTTKSPEGDEEPQEGDEEPQEGDEEPQEGDEASGAQESSQEPQKDQDCQTQTAKPKRAAPKKR